MGLCPEHPEQCHLGRNPPEAQSWPTKRQSKRSSLMPPSRNTSQNGGRPGRRRRRSTMRRSKTAFLNLRSAETFLVGKLVLPSPPPARRLILASCDWAFSLLEDFVL